MSVLFTQWKPVLLALFLAADLTVFFLYGIDKRKAKRGAWRIPEKTLLLAAIPGGAGALCGMLAFRHKTNKWYFRAVTTLCCAAQLIALLHLFTV